MALLSKTPTQRAQPQLCSVTCSPEKAEYLAQLASLSVESLRILAEKSRKPGIEQKLKNFQHFI